jgi:mRNA interferase RelE/StbE
MYSIEYRRPARKALLKIPKATAMRFLTAFEQLASNPRRHDLDVKPMTGREGYRLRIGDWRALYRIENDRLVILVVDIGPRGDIYK